MFSSWKFTDAYLEYDQDNVMSWQFLTIWCEEVRDRHKIKTVFFPPPSSMWESSATMYICSSSFCRTWKSPAVFTQDTFSHWLFLSRLHHVLQKKKHSILSHYFFIFSVTHAIYIQKNAKVHKVSEDLFGNYMTGKTRSAVVYNCGQ